MIERAVTYSFQIKSNKGDIIVAGTMDKNRDWFELWLPKLNHKIMVSVEEWRKWSNNVDEMIRAASSEKD